MPVDHIRYDILAQDALRGVVRHVLADAAKNGPARRAPFLHLLRHHARRACSCRTRLRAQYPEEMTIVLQHQFWDLEGHRRRVRGRPVVRRRAGAAARAVRRDQGLLRSVGAVRAAVRDRRRDAGRGRRRAPAEADDAAPKRKPPSRGAGRDRPATPRAGEAARSRRAASADSRRGTADTDKAEPTSRGGAEVVRLDRFRKK